MLPVQGQPRHVLPPSLSGPGRSAGDLPGCIVDVKGDLEGQGRAVLRDYERRPRRHVLAADDTPEVNEGNATLHREPKARVVSMLRVHAAEPITNEATRGDLIVIGTGAPLDDGYGGDAQGYFGQDGRLEDALRAHERNALPFEPESLGENRAGQNVASDLCLIDKKSEGCPPHAFIERLLTAPAFAVFSHVPWAASRSRARPGHPRAGAPGSCRRR